MIESQHRIEIGRSPAEVFAALSDVERLPEWQASVIGVTRTTPGALQLGSEFTQTWKTMGRRRQVASRVVAYTPDELIAFAGDAGFLDYYCGFELSATASGHTTLVSRAEFRPHGLWRALQPVLRGELERELGSELAAFQRLVEAGRPLRGPATATS